LQSDLTTVSNLVVSVGTTNGFKLNITNGISVGLSNKISGALVSRSIDNRFIFTPQDFGAIVGDDLDDLPSWRLAVTAAITAKGKLMVPPGIYNWTVDAETALLDLDEVPVGGFNYNAFAIEGEIAAKRISRLDTDPDQTYSRGAVIKITGNMAGKIAIQTGTLTRNILIKNLTLEGTGWDVDSIGLRHNVLSSYFEVENVTLQQLGTAIDIGGDYLTEGDANSDYNTFRRVTTMNCGIGVKVNNLNAYVTSLYDCDIAARICVWNAKAAAGVTLSPRVNIFGGFLAPLTEYGGVLLTGLVTSATSSSISITNLTKFTKSRNVGTFVMSLDSASGSISDVATNMYVMAEANCNATGASRVPTWGVINTISAIDSGTWTLSTGGTVDTTLLAGQPVYVVRPAMALYGDHFNLIGVHIEQTQAEDLGFGSMIGYLTGFGSTTTLRNCFVNLFSSGTGLNAIQPILYHANLYSFHAFPLTVEDNTFNILYPKFEVTGTTSVRFRNNKWYCSPLILDHNGTVASGVTRSGDSHYLKPRFPYAHLDGNLEFRALVAAMGSDNYEQINGLNKRPFRTVRTTPTTGTSGEVAAMETSPTSFYRMGTVSSLEAYYDASAISAGTAAISSGSAVATVTNLTGLYVGRAITIAGAGSASGTLTTRIVDLEITPAGTKRIHLFTAAGTTVTAGTIAAVSPVVENSQLIGRADATAAQLRVLGGSSGTDLQTWERTDGVTQTFAANLSSGEFNLYDKTTGSNLLTLKPTGAIQTASSFGISSTNAQLKGNLTANGGAFTNSLTLGGNTVATSANHLGFFSATTSLQLKNILSDETGSGSLVFGTAPTLSAPIFSDYTDANHDHLDADDGGTLDAAAIAAGTLSASRLPQFTGGNVTSASAGTAALNIATNVLQQKVWVQNGSTNIGVGDSIKFASGTNIVVQAEVSGADVLVTINSTASGGGGTAGTMITTNGAALTGAIPYQSDATTTNFVSKTNLVFYAATNQAAIYDSTVAANTATTSGILLNTPSTASSGNQYASPTIKLRNQAYKSNTTAESQEVGFNIFNLGVQGTTAASTKLYFVPVLNAVTNATPFIMDSVNGTFSAGTITANFGNVTASSGGFISANTSGYFITGRGSITATADGVYTLLNNGQGANASLKVSKPVSAKTTAYTVTATENGTVFTNEGATAQVVFTLPTAVANYSWTFVVQDADGLRVDTASGDTLRIGGTVTASDGYVECATIGKVITIVAINATEFIEMSNATAADWTFGP
jgi:hypothetical protein